MKAPSPDDLPEGIALVMRGDKWIGYRAFQWVPWPGYPNGRVRSKRYTRKPGYEPTFREMQAWQDARRVEARARQRDTRASIVEAEAGSFLGKADLYLETVQAMPKIKDRTRHMDLWAQLFGDRDPLTIEPQAIRAQRDRWLTVGPRIVQVRIDGVHARVEKPLPLSPQEVNLRLRALENFFTVMFPTHENPVRAVPECEDAALPRARGQSFALAREVMSYMPDVTTPAKGGTFEQGSLSRVRFEAMLVTALTPKQIGELREVEVDYATPAITPPLRLKGRSSARRKPTAYRIRTRPLIPSAVPVLKRLFALGGNRPFSRQSLQRSVRRAVAAANRVRTTKRLPLLDETLRLYDWTRHTFGTEAYRAYRDLEVVRQLMGHSDIRQTRIYAQAAMQEHVVAAVAELDKRARPDVASPRRLPRRGGKVGGKVSPPYKGRPVRTRQTGIQPKPQ